MPLFFQTEDLVRRSLEDAIIDAERRRKKEHVRRNDFYAGDQVDYVKAALATIFSQPEKLHVHINTPNVTRKIVRALGLLYKEPPARRWEGGSDREAQVAEALYAGVKADVVMRDADRMTTLHRMSAIVVNLRGGRVVWDLLTPDQFTLVPSEEDPSRPAAFIYERRGTNPATNRPEVWYVVWTATEHYYMLATGETFVLPGQDGTNPYGVIPAVVFYDEDPRGETFLSGGEDLIQGNLAIDTQLTWLNHLILMQSFGQPVAVGRPPNSGPLGMGVDRTIDIPVNPTGPQGDFKFVTPQADIEGVIRGIWTNVELLATNRGISPTAFKLEQTASGIALKIENIEVLEHREDRMPLFSDYEQSLWSITRTVHNTWAPAAAISEAVQLRMDYAEPSFPIDPESEHRVDELRVRSFLMSPAEWLRKLNPDITSDEEALLRLRENREQYAEIFGGGGVPSSMQGGFTDTPNALPTGEPDPESADALAEGA